MSKEIRLVSIDNLREKLDNIAMGKDMANLLDNWYSIADELEKKHKEKGSLYLFKETEKLYDQIDTDINNLVKTLDALRELVNKGRA